MKGYLFDTDNRVWVRPNYSSRIEYSDGYAVENKIFESVRNSNDLSVLSEELEAQITDWTSLCFLSKRRSNLLRPFAELFKGKNILEVGCGAGPITRFLAECGALVYGVEPAIQRAKIAAERCRDLENVKIFCDDIEGFAADLKFDGIVQVGVLEYATKYSTDQNAPVNFVKHLRDYLKDDGFLITAIENQLGLKYFSGFFEDHVGSMMYGINDNYQAGEPKTPGRKTLIKMFEAAGFSDNQLFLPFPDYKLPSLVIYPRLLENAKDTEFSLENILSGVSFMDRQKNVPLFSLDKTLPLISENDLLYDLSNSFCLFSRQKEAKSFDERVLLSIYNTDRKKEFCKETVFRNRGGKITVSRNYLLDASRDQQLVSFEPEEAYQPGTLYHYELVKIVNRDNWTIDQVHEWLSGWLNVLKQELRKKYGFEDKDFLDINFRINSKYVDAIPLNLIVNKGGSRFIDLELALDHQIELGYLVFRAIYVSITRLSSLGRPQEVDSCETAKLFPVLFSKLGYNLSEEQLDKYYVEEATLASRVANVKLNTLKGSVDRLRIRPPLSDVEGLVTREREAQEQNQAYGQEIKAKDDLLQEWRRKVEESDFEKTTLTKDVAEKAKQLKVWQEARRRWYELLSEKTDQLKSLEQVIQEKHMEIEKMRDSEAALETKLREKTSELVATSERVERATNDLQHQSSLNDNYRKSIESLELRLRDGKSALSEAEDVNKSQENHIRYLENHVKNLEHEIYSLSTSRKRMIKQFFKRSFPFLVPKRKK